MGMRDEVVRRESNHVAQQEEHQQTVQGMLVELSSQIAKTLPAHMDGDRLARIAFNEIRKSDLAKAAGAKTSLSDCTPLSFAASLMTATALGLEPGVNAEAYLIPYGRECTLVIGYHGMLKLAWQHPAIKNIDTKIVYENDHFEYGYGFEPWLEHRPAKTDRGAPILFYSVAVLHTGARHLVVLSPEEVRSLRQKGPVAENAKIIDPQQWMSRKTTLRQLLKPLPKSITFNWAQYVDERPGTMLAHENVVQQVVEQVDPPMIRPSEASPDDPYAGVPDGPNFSGDNDA